MTAHRDAPGGPVLRAAFYSRSTLVVARELIGSTLCYEEDGICRRLVISEVEAYDGFEDKASHAHRGRTARNQVMFEFGGLWYIYLCYGIHWMLNVVVGKSEYPAAVLIRGAGEFDGPGRLTRGLQIDRTLNGAAATPSTGLWIEESKIHLSDDRVVRTPRIGVGYAGAEWAGKRYRFALKRSGA